MKTFLTQLMSGTDNQTPAIGRYLGALLFLGFLFILPTTVAIALWLQQAKWETWDKMFSAMTLYVPAMATTIVGLIRVLHPTEPNGPSS